MATDWATVSALATAGGTLVLAVATFSSVRSANRSARVAELALQTGLRPLLFPSREQDPSQKVMFADQKWFVLTGSGGAAEATPDAVYLAIALRNVGSGIAVLQGWRALPRRELAGERPDPELLRHQSRDIYIPAGDIGFWQGALREPAAPEFAPMAAAVAARGPVTVDLLYGDQEGGQRVVTRFGLLPRGDDGWFASAGRHWVLDRADPRVR